MWNMIEPRGVDPIGHPETVCRQMRVKLDTLIMKEVESKPYIISLLSFSYETIEGGPLIAYVILKTT